MKWSYKAYDPQGTPRKGKLEAPNAEDAYKQVTSLGFTPTEVKKSGDIEFPWSRRPPGLKDKAIFTQQFAQLLGGNVPQNEALGVAARSTTNTYLREAVEKIRVEVEEGQPIEDVFARKEFAKAFDPVFVAFLRMGTESGNLARPLKELGDMYKWQLRIFQMVKKGLTLPVIIMVACLIVTYFIMSNVVPTFMKILDGLHAELPPITKMVKTVSELASNPLVTLAILLIISGIYFAIRAYRSTPAGKLKTDTLLLRLFVVGPLMQTFILARMSRAIAVMLANQIPLANTLQLSGAIAGNAMYAQHMREVRRAAIDGHKMAPVLMRYPKEFPEQYTLQFRAAENNARLDETLIYLGEIYNDEVTTKVEALTTALEPFLMVFLGVVVGTIVVAVFLPMTSMMQALEK
ncbi:type II secretion system F family protein [Deinococcus ruber]|uniref:Phytochrome sensor protein n=1 Tax=Deinococcus ruber TaxID=1848197 RepID=A0A918CNV4_9DEIO|nr:type II secretion system F family protein [Deinococcus ruber]GGR32662.1 phytochrome sensor protein [Deinococcus ruber]